MFVIGASLVAAIPQTAASAEVNPEALAQLPVLRTVGFKFDQPELHAKAGETVALRLENGDGSTHSFDIDAFNVHVSMLSNKPGFALFRPTKPGTYTFYCAIPDHLKAGMVGTLIVEP